MRTILLATDGSPSAARATATAIELAQATGWDLHIVTAWSIPMTTYGFTPITYVPDMSDFERDSAAKVLAAAVETARTAGLEPTSELRQGRSAEEICAAAEESGAAIVVLGAHGWGAVKRLLAGSVSTGVLHHASCPVLVVRGESVPAAPELVGNAAEHAG